MEIEDAGCVRDAWRFPKKFQTFAIRIKNKFAINTVDKRRSRITAAVTLERLLRTYRRQSVTL